MYRPSNGPAQAVDYTHDWGPQRIQPSVYPIAVAPGTDQLG